MENNRREFFTKTAAMAAAAGLGALAVPAILNRAGESNAFAASKNDAALAEVAKTAADCIRTGDACIAHCAKELASGNKTMAHCNERTHEMVALVSAMTVLASLGSDYAVKLAPICAAACKDCESACAEHKDHFAHGMHLVCKACMEACQACEAACQKLV